MSLSYKNITEGKNLFLEGLSIKKLAAENPTPFYAYSKAKIVTNYQEFANSFKSYPTTICFAVKSCPNINILKILANLGSGADVVSGGEIARCAKAGIDMSKIVFSGVGKTTQEMEYALKAGIGQFNCESNEEITLLNEVATSLGVTANIALRLNPDIDAVTHEKITTGRKIDKFGIPWEERYKALDICKNSSNIQLVAIACHIGSQITLLAPFIAAAKKIKDFCLEIKANFPTINAIDLGGGLGVKYKDEEIIEIKKYADSLIEILQDSGLHLNIEPGRRISADAGILVGRVQYIKTTNERQFAIIDAGMNDLMRPAIYTAYHEIIAEKSDDNSHAYDIVGPVCESSDIWGRQRPLPEVQSGDLLVIKQAGAYGMSMANTYNTRPLIAEFLVDGNDYKQIRRRQTIEDIFADEL